MEEMHSNQKILIWVLTTPVLVTVPHIELGGIQGIRILVQPIRERGDS